MRNGPRRSCAARRWRCVEGAGRGGEHARWAGRSDGEAPGGASPCRRRRSRCGEREAGERYLGKATGAGGRAGGRHSGGARSWGRGAPAEVWQEHRRSDESPVDTRWDARRAWAGVCGARRPTIDKGPVGNDGGQPAGGADRSAAKAVGQHRRRPSINAPEAASSKHRALERVAGGRVVGRCALVGLTTDVVLPDTSVRRPAGAIRHGRCCNNRRSRLRDRSTRRAARCLAEAPANRLRAASTEEGAGDETRQAIGVGRPALPRTRLDVWEAWENGRSSA